MKDRSSKNFVSDYRRCWKMLWETGMFGKCVVLSFGPAFLPFFYAFFSGYACLAFVSSQALVWGLAWWRWGVGKKEMGGGIFLSVHICAASLLLPTFLLFLSFFVFWAFPEIGQIEIGGIL